MIRKIIHIIQYTRHILQKFLLSDYILILFLILLSLRIRCNVFDAFDIGLHDKTIYLAKGLFFLQNLRLPSITYSPLYVLWYSILELVISDPIDVYYIQYLVTAALTVIVLYFAMRRLHISKIVSFVLCSYWTLLYVNMYRMLYVYHFAFLLSTLGIITITMRNRIKAVIFTVLVLTLVFFSRFEYIISLTVFLTIIIVITLRKRALLVDILRKDRISKSTYLIIIFFICLLFLFFKFTDNSLSDEANKLWTSFGTGYVLRCSQATSLSKSVLDIDWVEVIHNHFPGANSLLQAILVNPAAVMKYVWLNLKDSPDTLFRCLFETALFRIYNLRIFPIFILSIIIIINRLRSLKQFLLNRLKESRMKLVFIYIACISLAVIPSFFVGSYIDLFFPLVFLIFFCFAMYINDLHKDTLRRIDSSVSVFVLFILFMLSINAFPDSRIVKKNYENIVAMRRILSKFDMPSSTNKVVLLDAESQFNTIEGYNVYIDFVNCIRVDESEKDYNEGFFRFLVRKNINAILVTEKLRGDVRYRDDVEFIRFTADPEEYGWREYSINRTNSKFYLKASDVK